MSEPNVIFQDSHILVIDKPGGWIVNEAETTGDKPVLQSWLKKNFTYDIVDSREYRSGIVHRLDKETSGLLIVAKTIQSFSNLQAQFKERQVKKNYLALVHGFLTAEKGEISVPVGRLPWRRDRFGILPGGRPSFSNYTVVGKYKGRTMVFRGVGNFTLVKFFPQTGRTHQIRVHAKYLGHPIVADDFYAGRKIARADRVWCKRLFLHAHKITFTHPETGRLVNFVNELPEDLSRALTSLEKVN